MFKRNIKVRFKGIKKYNGDFKEISKQIIDSCWNTKKGFFQVSSGHFQAFYVRDFCFVIAALLRLGYKKQVQETLEFALKTYKQNNKITTSINSKGEAFDFPYMAIDSLPCLIRCLRILNATYLIDQYKDFLTSSTKEYYKLVVDERTGLVKRDKYFSSIKDHHKRKSCCYDNVMLAMLSKDLNDLKLYNPMREYDYPRLIKFNFWSDNYFIDEENTNYIAGDANIFPFFCGIYHDKAMLNKVKESIEKEGLDKPFPLKYVSNKKFCKNTIFASFFASNYEGDSIWLHLGLIYLTILKKDYPEKVKEYLDIYINLINKHKNFLEVYNPNGKPFNSLFYYTDDSLIWVSIALDLYNQLYKE